MLGGNYFEKLVLSTNEFYRKPYMADLWRILCRDRVYLRRFCALSDGCRDPIRDAMLQTGEAGALAFWQADRADATRHGVHLPFLQYHLADLRWIIYRGGASCFCLFALYHGYRDTIRPTASQAHGALTDAVRATGDLTNYG